MVVTNDPTDALLNLLGQDAERHAVQLCEREVTAKVGELENAFCRWWARLDRIEREDFVAQKELLDRLGDAWRSRPQSPGSN